MSDADVIIAGAGPAGSTAALAAARRGLRVVAFERDRHPRFHVGESFLPRNLTLMRELGLESRLDALPRTRKLGASFALGGEATTKDFRFADSLATGDVEAVNLERGPFDAMLAGAAVEAGATLHTDRGIKAIESLDDAGVRVRTDDGEVVRAKLLLDCTGQNTLVGRHLGTRRTLPDLRKVAYFAHYTGAEWREGDLAGNPVVVMCREGWFWLIPLDGVRVSVGLVMGMDAARTLGLSSDEVLSWGIERCPLVRRILRHSPPPERVHVCADFSYQCRPYAGPGYFLVGDAAVFVDPIFSTGVCMGMMSAYEAAEGAGAIIQRGEDAGRVRARYARYVEGSSEVFFRLVRRYYRHSFRELFLHGQGPFGVHRAIMSLLAGHVFPRPAWRLRWRQRFFEALVRVQDRLAIVPRRADWSLAEAPVGSNASTMIEAKPVSPAARA